jgi:hypothetical protein
VTFPWVTEARTDVAARSPCQEPAPTLLHAEEPRARTDVAPRPRSPHRRCSTQPSPHRRCSENCSAEEPAPTLLRELLREKFPQKPAPTLLRTEAQQKPSPHRRCSENCSERSSREHRSGGRLGLCGQRAAARFRSSSTEMPTCDVASGFRFKDQTHLGGSPPRKRTGCRSPGLSGAGRRSSRPCRIRWRRWRSAGASRCRPGRWRRCRPARARARLGRRR